MPTGYTADVESGKLTDFKTFALRCARAFGACIMQRDDSLEELPKHREPSDYHASQLTQSREKLAMLQSMTPGDVEIAAEADYQKRLADWRRSVAEDTAQNERYAAMLEKVNSWEPPTEEHEGLKKFMTEQLKISMNDMSGSFYQEPKRQMPGEWLKSQIHSAQWNVDYHEKGIQEEAERCKTANAWIDALYESLKP